MTIAKTASLFSLLITSTSVRAVSELNEDRSLQDDTVAVIIEADGQPKVDPLIDSMAVGNLQGQDQSILEGQVAVIIGADGKVSSAQAAAGRAKLSATTHVDPLVKPFVNATPASLSEVEKANDAAASTDL